MTQSEIKKIKFDDTNFNENKILLSNTGNKKKGVKFNKLVGLFDQIHDADFSGKNYFMLFLLLFIEKTGNTNKLHRYIQRCLQNHVRLQK